MVRALFPALKGFEAFEGADPAAKSAVEPLQEVVANSDQQSLVVDLCAIELGDDVPILRHGFHYGRR